MLLGREKDELRTARIDGRKAYSDPDNKYISLNLRQGTKLINAIVVDIDDSWGDQALPKIWDLIDGGLIPEPNWICGTKKSLRGEPRLIRPHLVYVLQYPVRADKITQKFKFDAIVERLYDEFSSHDIPVDRKQPVVTKSPFSRHWELRPSHSKTWTLDEIAEIIGISELTRPEMREINFSSITTGRAAGLQNFSVNGRNDELFKETARRVYRLKACGISSETALIESATRIADELNLMLFRNPLPHCEIRSIGNSVGRWTARNYVCRRGAEAKKDRGACHREGYLTGHESRREKQSVGAWYANSQRTEKSLKAVKEARKILLEAGKKVTVRNVAEQAGISKTTAQKFMKIIND